MGSERRTVAVDFDGVLHRYDTPWIAPHVIPDLPVEGAIEWLHRTIQVYDVVILSTRCRTWRGRRAIRGWLQRHAGTLWYDAPGCRGIEEIRCTYRKVPALVYVDDRALRFTGSNWPSTDRIRGQVPWHKMRAAPPEED